MTRNQEPLFTVSTHLDRVDPDAVRLRRVGTDTVAELQSHMSRAIWRAAPGRKMGYLVEHGDDVIGLLFFASPVVNLAVRDEYLGIPKDPSAKGTALRHFADLSVCVAAQPFGWYWNGGKLCAMLATTVGTDYRDEYGDHLRGIVTTSLWGRGSQYNRVYRFLGYTKGHGHEHISDDDYMAMLRWMRRNGVEIPSSRFGDGSNPRMRRIQAYRRASGDHSATTYHGQRRGVYYAPTVDTPRVDVVREWLTRWGQPRWERKRDERAPYTSGTEVAQP